MRVMKEGKGREESEERVGLESTVAASSQPDSQDVSRSDHSADAVWYQLV